MKLFASLVLAAATTAVPAAAFAADDSQSVRAATDATPKVNAGMMLYTSTGYRLAPIYRVSAEGNPQIILDGKLITVPATSLTAASGKVATSLSKKDLADAK